MNGYVIYVIDTETTGLNPIENDVIEISMCKLIPLEDQSYREEQKTWLLRALNPKTISDAALAKNSHKKEDILCLSKYGKENYKQPLEVLAEIEAWMSLDDVSSIDRIWAGQNPMFDVNAMQELYKRCGVGNFPFEITNGNRVIDTKQIAVLFDICTGRRRRYYNLSSLVKACGIKKGKAHRADEDTRMTKDLLVAFVTMIKPVVAEQFKNCYSDDDT